MFRDQVEVEEPAKETEKRAERSRRSMRVSERQDEKCPLSLHSINSTQVNVNSRLWEKRRG